MGKGSEISYKRPERSTEIPQNSFQTKVIVFERSRTTAALTGFVSSKPFNHASMAGICLKIASIAASEHKVSNVGILCTKAEPMSSTTKTHKSCITRKKSCWVTSK